MVVNKCYKLSYNTARIYLCPFIVYENQSALYINPAWIKNQFECRCCDCATVSCYIKWG